MLKLYLNEDSCKDRILECPLSSFTVLFQEEWGYNKFAKRIVEEIERAKFTPPNICVHEDFGTFPITNISGGCRILLYLANGFPNVFESNYLGDNCAELLKDISREMDCELLLTHMFPFSEEQEAYVYELGKVLKGEDILYHAARYVR